MFIRPSFAQTLVIIDLQPCCSSGRGHGPRWGRGTGVKTAWVVTTRESALTPGLCRSAHYNYNPNPNQSRVTCDSLWFRHCKLYLSIMCSEFDISDYFLFLGLKKPCFPSLSNKAFGVLLKPLCSQIKFVSRAQFPSLIYSFPFGYHNSLVKLVLITTCHVCF